MKQYVDDFKTAHEYDLVIGLGSEGIVSTSDGMDVSALLQDYVNQQYRGK